MSILTPRGWKSLCEYSFLAISHLRSFIPLPDSTKHSSFSTTFPIYLFTQRTEEVPDEDAQPDDAQTAEESEPEAQPEDEAETGDEDEVIVEEAEESKEPEKEVKMKSVTVDEWLHLNSNPPLWVR
jgi:heat shock protein beta